MRPGVRRAWPATMAGPFLRARLIRIGAGVAMGATAVATACLDLGGPSSGVVSISPLSAASPAVVLGDILRDSLGAPAPLGLIAYDPSGNPIPGEPVTFVALDTTIQIDASGIVHGIRRDSVGARVVGGAGSLQTAPVRLFVSVAPQTATKSTAATAITFDVTTPDTTVKTNWSPALTVTLTGSGGTPAQGFIVSYEITRALTPFTGGGPTAYLADDAGRRSTRDTTDKQGVSGRFVVIRQAAVNDGPLLVGTKTDTIIVRATAKYLGVPIAGSPIDFFIPVKHK